MGQVEELNIKSQAYYFFDDIINVRNFHPNLLKIDKKSHKDITKLVTLQSRSLVIVKIFIA